MKECKVIGYGTFTDERTNEETLRITIGLKSDRENYKGYQCAVAYIPSNPELVKDLNSYIENPNGKYAYYETTDNVITGKTKITSIVIK